MRGWMIVLIVSGTALVATVATWSFSKTRDATVEITAHRGSSATAPENTIRAVEQAIADGADYAEIDVQQTADGVIVLLHDDDLARIAGVSRGIGEMTYGEVKDLDAGSWFSPRFAGERIPTLAEVIETARSRIRLNIELKSPGRHPGLVEGVVDLVRREAFQSQCVITSFDHAALATVKTRAPELVTGAIVGGQIDAALNYQTDFLSLEQKLVTTDLLAAARRRGLLVHVWTVDDPNDMARLIDLGVDNIITNRPAVLADLRTSRPRDR